MHNPVSDKVNILLVDDQPARLLSYQTVLEPLNQNLVCARSGTEALQRLMDDEYALVLLDVSMPEMDGFETAAMIHEHPRFELTPIIFVTGVHDTELDRLKGYKLGAVDYVSIPVVPEILRGKVAVLVELHCKRRELQKVNETLAAANRQLEAANSNLQAERTRELQALNVDLKAANRELGQSNLALQHEIAERIRAESALKEADHRKDEFLAVLAHELRNPLAALSAAANLLGSSTQKPEILAMARDALHRQVHHMAHLLDDLLDVARITHGLVELRMETVDLDNVLHGALESVRPQAEAKGHRLQITTAGKSVFVSGDAVRLHQIVTNLLSNAIKYTPEKGDIELRLGVEDGQAAIGIRDNGIGIAEHMLDRVFEMFSQVNRSSNGLGIGLALVKGLVTLHGGVIRALSDGEGCGSEFMVLLPLAAEPRQVQAPDKEEDRCEFRPLRILVADDNVDSARSWSLLLEQEGHEVRTAFEGTSALAAADQLRPQVVLLDIGMPDMSGYEVARRIRATGWGEQVVLIAITGWGQERDRLIAFEAGFNHHFTKPVRPHEISAILRHIATGAGDEPRAAAPAPSPAGLKILHGV